MSYPDLKQREYRLKGRYDDLCNIIRRRLHAFDDPEIAAFANHLSEVEDPVQADQLNDLDLAECKLQLRELGEIDTALLRIRSGTYGVCEDCGAEIPIARLTANFYAKRCLPCAEKFEVRPGNTEPGSI